MRTNLLSKSDTADITKEISSQWGSIGIPRAKNARVYHLEDATLIEIGGTRILRIDGKFLPFLGDAATLSEFPSVTVDMGAVKFMCNGANVMRPGIRENTEFAAGQVVCVIEESHRKVLAVGIATVDSSELATMERGEVVRNMHYISDKHWETAKEIEAR